MRRRWSVGRSAMSCVIAGFPCGVAVSCVTVGFFFRVAVWCLSVGLLAAACASDVASEQAGHAPAGAGGVGMNGPPVQHGGYTGSLVPVRDARCGVGPVSQVGIPEGDAIAVLHTAGCQDAEQLRAELQLSGPAGAVPVTTEPLGTDGTFLVRSEQAVTAGSYSLSAPQAETQALQIGEASPLPTELGVLSIARAPGASASADTCVASWSLTLDLSPAARAYAALLQIVVSVDGNTPTLWFDYGELPASAAGGAPLTLALPRCDPECLSPGTRRVTVQGRIAGESMVPEAAVATFDNSCPAATSSATTPETATTTVTRDEPSDCHVSPGRASSGGWVWLWLSLAALGLCGRCWRSK